MFLPPSSSFLPHESNDDHAASGKLKILLLAVPFLKVTHCGHTGWQFNRLGPFIGSLFGPFFRLIFEIAY